LLNRTTAEELESVLLVAPVVEWNYDRGYGFLQKGTMRVFLHIRDFSRRRKQPQIGDIIRFKMGRDAQGRPCAVKASCHKILSGISLRSLFLLALLLVLPAFALKRVAPDPKLLFGYLAGITILTWAAYYHDKKRARSGGWRVPESNLHLLEIIGGWPAAFLAQRCLRHKSSKTSFKVVFWFIVLLHQFIALDSLQHWKFTSAALSSVQHTLRR
jgi:uncharacterized membrane protein YsdA (DUF1294 family)/cold shock CspA family protein